MGRVSSRMFLAVLLLLGCTTACAMSPPSDQPGVEPDTSQFTQPQGRRAAQALLDEVVRQVLRDDTGSFGSHLRLRGGRFEWSGSYGIDAERAELLIRGFGRNARERSTLVDVLLDGGKAYVRETPVVAPWHNPWIEVSRRHIFPDLACWPAKQRRLPDRSLMLLFSARAVRLEGDRNQSVIVATVPARLASTIFPEPSLVELVGSDAMAPVTVRIGNFRGQLTTLELRGSAIKAMLERAGVPLRPGSARDLSAASYSTIFSSFGNPLLVHPPAPKAVVDTGADLPPPQAWPCANTTV